MVLTKCFYLCVTALHQILKHCSISASSCRGVVLLNGAGRIEDVQTAVEAPVTAALKPEEKEALAAIDPDDFRSDGTFHNSAEASTSKPSSQSGTTAGARQSEAPAPSSKQQSSLLQTVFAPLATIAKRVAVYGSFILTKQPGRVKQVLQQVLLCLRQLVLCTWLALAIWISGH